MEEHLVSFATLFFHSNAQLTRIFAQVSVELSHDSLIRKNDGLHGPLSMFTMVYCKFIY